MLRGKKPVLITLALVVLTMLVAAVVAGETGVSHRGRTDQGSVVQDTSLSQGDLPPGVSHPCAVANMAQVRIRAGADGQTIVELIDPC